jgi:hypothetical protein
VATFKYRVKCYMPLYQLLHADALITRSCDAGSSFPPPAIERGIFSSRQEHAKGARPCKRGSNAPGHGRCSIQAHPWVGQHIVLSMLPSLLVPPACLLGSVPMSSFVPIVMDSGRWVSRPTSSASSSASGSVHGLHTHRPSRQLEHPR